MRLPWKILTPPERDRDYVVMASRLPLTRYRSIPAFLRATTVIRRQLAAANGLIGYTLDAQLLRKTFWTLSVWDSDDALHAFSDANPHHDRVDHIRPIMLPTTFTFWRVSGADVPVDWNDAKRHLSNAADSSSAAGAQQHQ